MDERFQIVRHLFRGTQDLANHHLDSYERLLQSQIPGIIRDINPIKIPLVQKTKAKILESGGDDDTGETVRNVGGSGGGDGESKEAEPIIYHEEDLLDVETYRDYDAVVSIFIGGKSADAITIFKPVRVSTDPDGNITKTPIYPNEARLRDMNYTSALTTDITIRILNINNGTFVEETLQNAPLFHLPVLVKSSICWLHGMTDTALTDVGEDPDDPGGYFIIDGAERVLVTQERVIPNLPYVNSVPEVMIACSDPDNTRVKILRLMFDAKGQGIVASIPGTKGLIPLAVVFRALGITTDKEIIETIFHTSQPDPQETDIVRHTIASGHGIYDQHSAFRLLTHVSRALTISSAKGIIHRQLLSQQQGGLIEKAAVLGDLARMLIHRKLGRIADTDRDSCRNKSLAVSGNLISELINTILQTREEEIRKRISSEYNYNYKQYTDDSVFNLMSVITRLKDEIFGTEENTSLLLRSMKGQWGADPARGIGTQIDGVSQALDRLTYTATLSHLRRVVLERVPEGKALLARRLHFSSAGYICPSETPSGGPKIGVVKNLAILASVSAGVRSKEIMEELFKLGVIHSLDISPIHRKGFDRVYLNGVLVGFTNKPLEIQSHLLKLRRNGKLHPTVSIAFNRLQHNLWIGCGPGRLLRPLIRVKDGKPMIAEAIAQMNEVIKSGGIPKDVFSLSPFHSGTDTDAPLRASSGVTMGEAAMELLDPWEVENSYIANAPEEVTPDHTHLEVHPSTMFGVMGCLIPFAPHNQAPRNIYSCAQGKQGTSVYSKAFMSRYDHSAMVLTSVQKPVVSTWYGRQIARGTLGYGTNLVVAIASFSGYNQEDGVLVNRTSVERGLFRVLKISEYSSAEENSQKTKTTIRFADPRRYPGIQLKETADYSYLDEEGLLPEGTIIHPDMVLFGRVSEQEGNVPRDVSVVAGKFSGGIVDSRIVLRTQEGLRKVKYRITKLRGPELGDKFSSRAGQKGTCGMLIPQVDMPRTKDGIVPDLIVNPHAIPSRMTIGQLQESVIAKLAMLLGTEVDSTAFSQNGVFSMDVGRLLASAGYDPAGDEMLYSGITGELLPTKIFIGPTYYMRLKHMSQDKINYRGGGVERGPVDSRTRQPVGGRAREGGLRIGEMERDSIISYGASQFLRESLTARADGEDAIVCAETGKRGFYTPIGYRSVEKDGPIREPVAQSNSTMFSQVSMPRGLTTLLNEMETMGIDTRIVTEGGDTRISHSVRVSPKDVRVEEPIEQQGEGYTIASVKSKTQKKSKYGNVVIPEIDQTGAGRVKAREGALKHLEQLLQNRKDTREMIGRAREQYRELVQSGQLGKGLQITSDELTSSLAPTPAPAPAPHSEQGAGGLLSMLKQPDTPTSAPEPSVSAPEATGRKRQDKKEEIQKITIEKLE